MQNSALNPVVLIPAYNPDQELINLVTTIKKNYPEQKIIVVNDGSKPEFEAIFTLLQAQNIIVLDHAFNRGKGEALKTGMKYFLVHFSMNQGVVTADADGQHCVEDIISLRQKLIDEPNFLHIGVREFSQKDIPLRSRFGNNLTRILFKLATKTEIRDTQSGLRGIPTALIGELIESKTSRYEFEFEMFFVARKLQILIQQTPIQTIYINQNAASHFNPLLDSLKIYYIFVRFCGVALLSFFIDFLLFSIFYYYQNNLVQAMIEARIVSASFNFMLNKNLTFIAKSHLLSAIIKYALLAIVVGFCSLKLTVFLSALGLDIYGSKIFAEFLLFIANFLIQYYFVFLKRKLDSQPVQSTSS
ncbi:MAG: bifunctional glycosyltransferase family 2/GtrA family protein [Tatlockia sp.]|nr:bifunctional glycosyltransferase family 2/GtrA family protein [Tatlockia sp.]